MKTILLLVSLIFAGMALGSCTNDEGEDLEILTPTEEEDNRLDYNSKKNEKT